MSIQVFTASDGRRFMSEKTFRRYEARLFAQNHLQILENPTNEESEIYYTVIENKQIWKQFIEYLKLFYFNIINFGELEGKEDYYLGKVVLIIKDVSCTLLKTFEEYKEYLLTKIEKIQKLIINIDAILIKNTGEQEN